MTAPTQAELIQAAEEAVIRAVNAQRQDGDPAHEDFYAWAGSIGAIGHRLEHLCTVLARQIAAYGDNHVLRDDAGKDPRDRLAAMQIHVDGMRGALALVTAAADRFHSEASHIAVESDRPERAR